MNAFPFYAVWDNMRRGWFSGQIRGTQTTNKERAIEAADRIQALNPSGGFTVIESWGEDYTDRAIYHTTPPAAQDQAAPINTYLLQELSADKPLGFTRRGGTMRFYCNKCEISPAVWECTIDYALRRGWMVDTGQRDAGGAVYNWTYKGALG